MPAQRLSVVVAVACDARPSRRVVRLGGLVPTHVYLHRIEARSGGRIIIAFAVEALKLGKLVELLDNLQVLLRLQVFRRLRSLR